MKRRTARMKRLTRWSHLVLGLALGIAPTAAWIAIRGSLDARIVVLTVLVMLWVKAALKLAPMLFVRPGELRQVE